MDEPLPPRLPRWAISALSALAGALAVAAFVRSPVPPSEWVLLAVFLVLGAALTALTTSPAGIGLGARERRHDPRRLEAELAEATRRAAEARAEADQLRETEKLRDAFLASVAHELRTPLSAMLGWAHVLREEDVDEATSARALDAILRNARVQTRLLSDLMDVSRIVAGTMQMEMQVVEPVAVIRAALEKVRPAAEARRVMLSATVDAEAGPVTADPSRLQQVLWNLLANSIKFTPEGGTVAVRVQAVGNEVEVKVEDTGPGIPPAFLPHVFDRFRQAGGTATPSKGGLGLGLSIARTLVELHHGSITAANRDPGPGAVFTVRLPVKALRPGESRPSAAAPGPESLPPDGWLPSLDGLRVLVMDADESRDLAATVLQKHGARTILASSSPEALAELTGQRPDVLLLDLELGDAGEGSLIRTIRALPTTEGGTTPAAAMASFGAGDRTRALLAGFQLQLTKPVRPAELVAVVASLAGRARPRPEAAEASA